MDSVVRDRLRHSQELESAYANLYVASVLPRRCDFLLRCTEW